MKKTLVVIVFSFFLFSSFQVQAKEMTLSPWQDETIYYVMIDRFNNGDFENDDTVNANDPEAYHGGDFEGIRLQLDYIKDMGFTTIALSPIFDNEENGYHGYWVNDFYQIEEHFGSLASFKKLVKEAHKREMKVIIDFHVNFIGSNHPWIKDPSKKDWVGSPLSGNENSPWLNGRLSVNLGNPETKDYFIDVAKWWVKETKIDGFNLNMKNVPSDFSEELAKTVKTINQEFLLLGDVAAFDAVEGNTYKGTDGLLDYPTSEKLRDAFSKPDQSTLGIFPKEISKSAYLTGTFMDNQWSERFTREAVQNNLHPGSRWKLALTYLYTTPGIPIVYYGTEIALDGGVGEPLQMDFRTDQELVEYITKLGDLREQLPSLTKGTFSLMYAKNGMMVYKREYEGETTVIAINNTSKSQNISLDAKQLPKNKELRGLLQDDLVKNKNGHYEIILDRDVAEVYLLTNKSGLNLPLITSVSSVYVAFSGFLFLLIKRRKRSS
jgi:alpha-amylase